MLFGLELVRSLSIYKLHFEGDSTIIINSFIKHHIYNWFIQYILHQVWSLLDSISECYIMHPNREENLLANCLANLGTNGFILTFYFPHLTSLISPTWLILWEKNMFRIRLSPPHILFDSKSWLLYDFTCFFSFMDLSCSFEILYVGQGLGLHSIWWLSNTMVLIEVLNVA